MPTAIYVLSLTHPLASHFFPHNQHHPVNRRETNKSQREEDRKKIQSVDWSSIAIYRKANMEKPFHKRITLRLKRMRESWEETWFFLIRLPGVSSSREICIETISNAWFSFVLCRMRTNVSKSFFSRNQSPRRCASTEREKRDIHQ